MIELTCVLPAVSPFLVHDELTSWWFAGNNDVEQPFLITFLVQVFCCLFFPVVGFAADKCGDICPRFSIDTTMWCLL
jgi:hypothetical protein